MTLLLTASLQPSVSARESKKSKNSGSGAITLKYIEDLYYISQDLDENTLITIKPEKGCYCSCRDSLWSCTDVSCEMHMKECQNPPPETAQEQNQSVFSWKN